MTEYTFYFATVCGLLKIRFESQRSRVGNGQSSYRTHVATPVLFCGVSAFIVIRSALSHWLVALTICCFLISGTALYRSLWWQRLVMDGSMDDTT